jgi:hypothetical protein
MEMDDRTFDDSPWDVSQWTVVAIIHTESLKQEKDADRDVNEL